MSSLLNFVLRHNGAMHQAVISSGGLSEIFNPLIFQGDRGAIESYFTRCTEQPMRDFCPWGSGLVVIDVDHKKLWDVQIARDLNVLSRTMDHSWMHLDLLEQMGWIGQGLIDLETGSVVALYPKGGMTFEWYDKQVLAHEKKFKKSHTEMSWNAPSMNEFFALGKSQPRIPFAPLDWCFMELPEDVMLQLGGLIADGFRISKKGIKEWERWVGEMTQNERL